MKKRIRSREVCFLLKGESILRAYIGSSGAVPDSARRWDDIWELRGEITEIVHSHPKGALHFSAEDLTTISAVEAALGRSLLWSVITESGYLSQKDGKECERDAQPWWLEFMRELSYRGKML